MDWLSQPWGRLDGHVLPGCEVGGHFAEAVAARADVEPIGEVSEELV